MRVTIVNWEKYNGRKDVKSPTWFRMQNTLFENPDFYPLNSTQKLLFVYLLTLASKQRTESPKLETGLASAMIKEPLRDIEAAVNALSKLGLIEIDGNDVTETVQARDVDVTTQTDGTDGTERVTKVTSASGPAPRKFFDLYNLHRGSLPEARALSRPRITKIKSRLREHPDLDYWAAVFKTAASNPFLSGDNDRGWAADFDWLVANDSNHLKVSEGNYSRFERPRETNEEVTQMLEATARRLGYQ